jgi:hypothetical protein
MKQAPQVGGFFLSLADLDVASSPASINRLIASLWFGIGSG